MTLSPAKKEEPLLNERSESLRKALMQQSALLVSFYMLTKLVNSIIKLLLPKLYVWLLCIVNVSRLLCDFSKR